MKHFKLINYTIDRCKSKLQIVLIARKEIFRCINCSFLNTIGTGLRAGEVTGLSCSVTADGYSDIIFINRFGATYCHGTLNKAIQRIVQKCNDEVLRQGKATPFFPSLAAIPLGIPLPPGCAEQV